VEAALIDVSAKRTDLVVVLAKRTDLLVVLVYSELEVASREQFFPFLERLLVLELLLLLLGLVSEVVVDSRRFLRRGFLRGFDLGSQLFLAACTAMAQRGCLKNHFEVVA
jgi:hypothetical protein